MLEPGYAVARHSELYDQYGRRVTVADKVVLEPQLTAFFATTVRFRSARLDGGTVRLIEGDSGLPTFVELFEPTNPTPPSDKGWRAKVEDMHLENVTVYGELFGLEGIRTVDVTADGRIDVYRTGQVNIAIESLDGEMIRPFPFVGHIDDLTGNIHTDPRKGVDLEARAHGEEGDRARATIRYVVPEGAPAGAEEELDLRVHVQPLEARKLYQMGYSWAELLRGKLRGDFRLQGPLDNLALSASLDTDGGPVSLDGHVRDDGSVDISGNSESLELGKVIEGAPALEVAGKAELHLDDAADQTPSVTLDLEPFVYQGWAVPSLTIEGVLEEERVRLEDVSAPYAGGQVNASGAIDYGGHMDVRVRGHIPQIARDRNLRRLVPDARGSLDADVRLATAPSGERLDFRGTLTLRNLSYGPLVAEWVQLRGSAHGDVDHPAVDLDIDGRGVRVADYPLGEAEIALDGGPRNYTARARFRAPGERRIELDASIEATGGRYVVNSDHIEFAVGDLVWRGGARNVAYRPDRDVVIDNIRLANGSQRLEAHGTWRFRGDEDLELQIQDFDLTGLRAIFGDQVPAMAGRVDSHVVIEQDIDNPRLLLEGAIRDAGYFGIENVNIVYVVSYKDGELSVDVQTDLGKRGNVVVVGSGTLDTSKSDPIAAFEGGVYEAEVAVSRLSLDVVREIAGKDVMPPLAGRIGGRFTASGPIQAPSFEGHLDVPKLALPGWPIFGLETEFSYQTGILNARAAAKDDSGTLVELEGNLLIDLVNLLRNPAQTVASLETVPWRLSARIPSRAIADFPAPVRAQVPGFLQPVKTSLQASFAGGALETRADLTAQFDWTGDLSSMPCGTRSEPHAILEAHLKKGKTTATLTGHLRDRVALRAEASASTPLDRWLVEAAIPKLPLTSVNVELDALDLGAVPGACKWASGTVSGRIEAGALFSDVPTLRTNLHSSQLRLRRFRARRTGPDTLAVQTPPVEAELTATLGTETLRATAELDWWNDGRSQIRMATPVQWGGEHLLPVFRDGGSVEGHLDMQQTPLAPLLAWVPGIVDVEGMVSGHVDVRGHVFEPKLSGDVRLQHGYLEIVPLGQQLSDLNGKLTFHEDWIEVANLTAHDRDGKLGLRGSLRLDGIDLGGMRLALDAEKFPIRQEGSILATLTGNALLDGTIEDDGTQADLTVRDLTVQLPEEAARSLQELEPHPDVVVKGRDQEDVDPADSYPIRISLKADEPFLVRRRDFAARVVTDLDAVYRDPQLKITGFLGLRRGFFEVFGKRFEVQHGRMDFTGSPEVNPQVNLVATHELPDRSGETVTVTVTGRLARPTVQFASSIPECSSRGAIVALLMSGRCSGEQAKQANENAAGAGQQAANFLAGITAGVLTLTAREEFGEVLPVIVIESGDQGFRSAKVRAGFEADSFIPDFLRPVVRGAYIEGFFTAGATGEESARTTSQGRDHGFLLELRFPYNIVGTGSFSPPSNWSLDFTWEP